jgi:hypothetical protein
MGNLLGLIKVLDCFPNLRDLRLTRSNLLPDDEWKALVRVINTPQAFTELQCLEIQGVPADAGEVLVRWAGLLSRLALAEARLDADGQSQLVQALAAINRLRQLELKLAFGGRLDTAAMHALGAWLARPDCSLRVLRLEGKMDQPAVQALASGLQRNHGLDTLFLDLGGDSGDSDSAESSDADSVEERFQPMRLDRRAPQRSENRAAEYTIAEQLPSARKLRSFCLRAGALPATEIAGIAIKVLESASLLELDLRGCAWNQAASKRLMSELQKNFSLVQIRLNDAAAEAEFEPLLLRNLRGAAHAGSSTAAAMPANTAGDSAGNT